MTPERKKHLNENPKESINLAEQEVEGYHRCPDWDGLVIGLEDDEWEACTCPNKQHFQAGPPSVIVLELYDKTKRYYDGAPEGIDDKSLAIVYGSRWKAELAARELRRERFSNPKVRIAVNKIYPEKA